MTLDRLSIQGVRNLEPVELCPGAGLNWLSGPNGAGKTSVLEALYVLARGRSFRTHRLSSVIQHGVQSLRVVARRLDDQRRLGMERSADSWRGRIDGRDCQRLSEFAAALPLVLMEPDSHRLIDGGPDHRRQFLDWQLFHVEPSYLDTWRRYARFLRQRNAALKAGAPDRVLEALEGPMIRAGDQLNHWREGQVAAVAESVTRLGAELGLRLPGVIELNYRRGHPPDQGLAESLEEFRQRDRELGYTRRGPHRADLLLSSGGRSAAQELSRGQQKLLALLLLLAKLELVAEQGERRPILLLDDPVSELDDAHLDQLLAWLSAQAVQVWVTATSECPVQATMFHVERGQIRSVV
ncbi:MAG: DNA replication/repair protein RecF [Wenzhouxiangella sp.]|nr:MAG: DNA replication/repair protein RecF [Wenzhouxiangella sp.]